MRRVYPCHMLEAVMTQTDFRVNQPLILGNEYEVPKNCFKSSVNFIFVNVTMIISYINASFANNYLSGWGFPMIITFSVIIAICEMSLIAWAYPRNEEDRMRKITFK